MTESTPSLAELTAGNSSFSLETPGLQLALDSTSLGEFKACPRKYYYSIVWGWQGRETSPHLTFGILLHRARESYDHARAKGMTHDDALDLALAVTLEGSWDRAMGRPWVSNHEAKHRVSLLRTVVWYLDRFGADDPIETVILANGRPAVELSFRFDAGRTSHSAGETLFLCGHIDRIGTFAGQEVISDIKTTGTALTPRWFQSWSPSNQFSLYTLAGKVAFARPVSGLVVDGIQVGATFARMQRGPVARPGAVVDEWLVDTGWWWRQMEGCAVADHWPQNDKACDMYGGCGFREVCAGAPGGRGQTLKAKFVRRSWDPLVPRGD